jgi:hypothetical protein
MLEKVAIKNGQSIETDNCITTIVKKDSKGRKGQTTILKDLRGYIFPFSIEISSHCVEMK